MGWSQFVIVMEKVRYISEHFSYFEYSQVTLKLGIRVRVWVRKSDLRNRVLFSTVLKFFLRNFLLESRFVGFRRLYWYFLDLLIRSKIRLSTFSYYWKDISLFWTIKAAQSDREIMKLLSDKRIYSFQFLLYPNL